MPNFETGFVQKFPFHLIIGRFIISFSKSQNSFHMILFQMNMNSFKWKKKTEI